MKGIKMDLRDNFKSRCPVRYNADGTHWYCKRQLSEKQEIESKTCNYFRCPGRELTEEEETQETLRKENVQKELNDLEKKSLKKNAKKKPVEAPAPVVIEEPAPIVEEPTLVVEPVKTEVILKKCEWHICPNYFESGGKKEKFCCEKCRRKDNRLKSRRRCALRKKEILAKGL